MRKSTNIPTWMQALRRTCSVAVVLLTIASLTVPSFATNGNYRLCFTQVVGLPITNPNQPPTIDGLIAGDPGWTQSFRYVFGNGTGSAPNAAFQGIRDNTNLYLGFEVNNDPTLDNNDLIVVALSPSDGGSQADDRMFHIYPNHTGIVAGTNSAPRLVDYWTNSNGWDTRAPVTPPAGVTIKVSNSGVAGNYSWFVEMSIPLTTFDIPASGRFGLYVNVMRVGTAGTAKQYYWPSFTGNGIRISPQFTPATSNWGDGTQDPTLATSCKGVSLDWSDITSSHPPDQIDATPGNSNTFSALLHNNSVDSAGNPESANNIVGTFSIANFGLSANWTPVPVGTPAGSAGPINISLPATTGTLSTSPAWNITDPALIANYKTHADQCILVDLNSTAPDCVTNPNNCVAFTNKSVKRNMWVLTASNVSRNAEISAKGYGPPPAGKTAQEFLLQTIRKEEVLKPGAPIFNQSLAHPNAQGSKEGGRVISRLNWALDGCRLSGDYITIKGTKYELCDEVGGFGAIVEHLGSDAVNKWSVNLEGPGLTRVDDDKNSYRLSVPQDGTVTLTTKFNAEDGSSASITRLAAFLDAGANLFSSSGTVHAGFSLNGGLEYIVNPHFSLEGVFGYHRFAHSVLADPNLYQFSLDGKAFLSTARLRPFVNAGAGAYKFGSASTYAGGNVGIGLLYDLSSRVGLQGTYNFHVVNTPAVTKFSTLQAGLRFTF